MQSRTEQLSDEAAVDPHSDEFRKYLETLPRVTHKHLQI
jgi:hypothetical protein